MSRCPVCDVDGDVEARAGTEATVGSVAGQLERRPVVACPDGHDATPAELVGATMEAVGAAIPRARGRILRADACAGCRAPLHMPARRTTRTVTVEPAEGPVMTAHLDLPMVRCGECATDQLPSRSQEDLTVVVPAMFQPG